MNRHRSTPLVDFQLRAWLLVLAMTACVASPAAIISYVGVDDTTGGNWRTTTTLKPLDADGDDVYGSFGYFNWATGAVGAFDNATYGAPNPLNGLPGGFTLSTPALPRASYSAGYPLFDDPTLAPGAAVTDINSGLAWRIVAAADPNSFAHGFFIDVDVTTTLSETLRIGIIHNGGGDRVTGIGMQQPGSGLFSSITGLNTRSSPQFRYIFFDVAGVAAGDTYRIFLRGEDAVGNSEIHLGLAGLSFDLIPAPIPEPSTFGLAALALALGLCSMRRRKRQD